MSAEAYLLGVDARLANETRRAGAGNYCAELLRALPAVPGAPRLRLYLDAPPRPDFPLSPREAEIRVLPAARAWTQRVLRAELRGNPPDVFFSPAAQLPLGCPCPAVATIFDLAFLTFPQDFTFRRKLRARMQLAHLLRAAAGLLAISESTASELQRLCGVPKDRITVAPAGCGGQFRVRPSQAEVKRVREAHGLSRPYLLYVGRIQPRKNLERLIVAFTQARENGAAAGMELVLAGGEGWLSEGIHRAANASPARDAIRFLGFVPEQDLPALMVGCEALALISLWEGFGLPVLEAMALGVPVLTADVGGTKEVAGDAALLIDPRDDRAIVTALTQLLTDSGLRRALSEKGPRRAAEFTWQETARQATQAFHRARFE